MEEDLFIEGKSLLDRSMESSEFERLDRKGMKSTGRTQGQEDFGEEELVLLYVRPPPPFEFVRSYVRPPLHGQ